MASKQEALRERVVRFYNLHRDSGKKFTVDHFRGENVPKSTIYAILKSLKIKRSTGSGRPPTIMTPRHLNSLKKLFNNKDNISQSGAASKFNCTQQYVSKVLKKVKIVARHKMRSPDYTPEQVLTVRSQCRWMSKNYRQKSYILDDESYFSLSGHQMPGNNVYYTDDVSKTPDNVKYKTKEKFEPKVMLYIVISNKGISKPWFKPSGIAVNQEVYQNECLKKILIPYLKENHLNDNYIFWPDKASSHYAKKTLEFLESKSIPFVPKDRNPTNLPQCRPIEDFFGCLKADVYKNNWKAQNVKELINRIRLCIRNYDVSRVQKACEGINTSLRNVADKGPLDQQH